MANKEKAPQKSTKSLSKLRSKKKGPISHMEIRPAKNSRGEDAFITRLHRDHSPEEKAAAMQTGKYMPSPEPEEVPHEDGQDMLDHVQRSFNIPDEHEDDEDEDGDEDDE